MSNHDNVDLAHLQSRLVQERNTRRDGLSAKKAHLLAILKANNIKDVVVSYDGEGDSGQIQDYQATDTSGNPIDLARHGPLTQPNDTPSQFSSLCNLIEEFCWDVLDAFHAGFENNDGGFGEFAFDVECGTVELSHNDRFVDVNHTSMEV